MTKNDKNIISNLYTESVLNKSNDDTHNNEDVKVFLRAHTKKTLKQLENELLSIKNEMKTTKDPHFDYTSAKSKMESIEILKDRCLFDLQNDFEGWDQV
jgi:hypothetical protein